MGKIKEKQIRNPIQDPRIITPVSPRNSYINLQWLYITIGFQMKTKKI